jgi:hypothetical protein
MDRRQAILHHGRHHLPPRPHDDRPQWRHPLTARTGVFFQARNLFNIAEYRYQIDPSYSTADTRVGTFRTFGVKGVF